MTDELLHIDMTVKERNIQFDLTFDPGFIADVCTKTFLNYNGACEPEVVHVMRRVIRPGDFVIDGGANVGFFTLLMSRLVGEQGHVEAFEPATVNFKKLRKNLEINKVENVTAVNKALWRTDHEQLQLYISHDTGLCSLRLFEGALAALPVGGLTLDRWCGGYDQRPRLIKLDVEGAEEDVLVGAKRLLEGVDFVICELNVGALDRFGSSQHDLRAYMERQGYEMFLTQENGDEPEFVSTDRVVEGPENLNVLFSTKERVRKAWEEVLS